MNDKRKDKIKKLFELSMSENEHEAAIALKQALSLMEKHNISKDDVYGQKMVEESFETPYISIPTWYSQIYNSMANISGCVMIYGRGNAHLKTKAKISIVGRERDAENALYLAVFISREMEKAVVRYKKSIKGHPNIVSFVKSYRLGFISNIYQRMQESKNKFFNEQSSGKNELVCVHTETRKQEAKDYIKNSLKIPVRFTNRSISCVPSAMDSGANDADSIQINSALNKQKRTLRIG